MTEKEKKEGEGVPPPRPPPGMMCCKRVYRSGSTFMGGRCEKKPSVEADGKWWCKTHSPEAEAKRSAKRQAGWDARMAKHRHEMAVEAERNTLLAAARAAWAAGWTKDAVARIRESVQRLTALESKP